MHPVLRLVRYGNVLVSFGGTVVGGLAALGMGLPISGAVWIPLLLAAASTGCVTAGGNVLNDVRDQASDRVNHPDRPLVTGAISVRSARSLVIGFLFASAVLVAPIALGHPWLAVILAGALASVLGYEYRFKVRGLPGNFLVSFLTAAVFLYGGAAVNDLTVVLPFAAMAFAATFSREVIKGMEDAAGDVDRTTLPRMIGMARSGAVARVSVALALLLSPVPLFSFLRLVSAAGIIYLGLVLAADAVFVASVAWLPAQLHREQTLSKGAMTVALVAFLAAAFR